MSSGFPSDDAVGLSMVDDALSTIFKAGSFSQLSPIILRDTNLATLTRPRGSQSVWRGPAHIRGSFREKRHIVRTSLEAAILGPFSPRPSY